MNTKIKNKILKLRFPGFSGEWEEKRLGEIAVFQKGKGISKADISEDGKINCIRYGELYTEYNEVIKDIKSKTNVNIDSLVLSKINDVIIPASGETQIDIATASCVLKDDVALGGDLNIIRARENGIFLSYYLNSVRKKDVARLSQGNSVVHLYSSQLKNLKLNIPQKQEQEKIASFLSVVDERIELLKKKKEAFLKYKKGVMQKIFPKKGESVPEIRFDGFDGEWEEKRLGEYLIHKSERNGDGDVSLVLSVSNKKGFISQEDQFNGHQVASKDLKNYKIVERGDIAYNPSRINVGSIAKLVNFSKGIVSPMYVVFKLKKELNSVFFENLYETHYFKYLIKIGCSGSVRDSLNFNDLERFKVRISKIEEQQKIASFLTSLDNKIDNINKKLTQAEDFKKGLLQRLFI